MPLLAHAISEDDSPPATPAASRSQRVLDHAPLLDDIGGNGGGAAEPGPKAWSGELRYLMALSAPAIVQLCTQQGLVVTNQVSLSHHVCNFCD